MLDDARNKSQPKLVYSRGGHIDSQRDQEGKTTSSVSRNFQTVPSKVEARKEESQKENPQQKLITAQAYHNLQSQQEYQRETQQIKQTLVRREFPQQEQTQQQILLQEQTPQPKQILQQEKPRLPKQTLQQELLRQPKQSLLQEQLQQQAEQILHQEHPRKPKQIDVGYISTRKGRKGSDASVYNDNLQTLSLKQADVSGKEIYKSYSQNSSAFCGNNDAFKTENTAGVQIQGKKIISSEKSSVLEKLANPSLTAKVSPSDSKRKLSNTSLASSHLFPKANIDADDIDCMTKPDSTRDCEKSVPKQIYGHTTVLSKEQTVTHQPVICKQEQNTLNQQQREVPESRLHITAIKVHRYIPEEHQTSPILAESTRTVPLSDTSSVPITIHRQPETLILPSSAKSSEEITQSELNQDWDQTPLSPTSATSPPKSILKNTGSIDQSNLSASSHPILVPEVCKEKDPDYIFSSKTTAKIDQFSTNDSANMVKGLIRGHVAKINSPPLQPKRHATAEAAMTNFDLKKDGQAPKKSVRFNSEVQLHLDSEVSTTQSLSVDA